MARDIYYQAVGNPIQIDRLPNGNRPDLGLPYHPDTPADQTRRASRLLFLFALLAIAAMFAQLMHLETSQATGVRSLLWTNVILATMAAFLLVKAIKERSARWLRLPAGCLATAFFFLNTPIPLWLQTLLASVAIGYFTWALATHWTALCTASPLDRTAALHLNRSWQGYLLPMALAPAGLLLLAQLLSPLLSAFVLLAIPLFQIAETVWR